METSLILRLLFWSFLVSDVICGSFPRGVFENEEPDLESLHGNHELTSETIRVSVNDPQQIIENPSILRGMEADAVQELLRTKIPIVRTSVNKNNNRRTTKTYTLGADGSIAMNSVTENEPVYTYSTTHANSGVLWPEINSPFWKRKEETTTSNEPQWRTVPNQFYSTNRRIIDTNNFNSEFPSHETQNLHSKEIQLPRSWNPSTWSNPGLNENSKNQINTANNPRIEPTVLPNLDELVKELYERKTSKSDTLLNPTTQYTPIATQYTSTTTQKPLATIDIKDIPITAVFTNNKPVEENVWTLFGPQMGANSDSLSKMNSAKTPLSQTSTRTFTRTFTSDSFPKSSDLSTDIQGILSRAGIDANEVKDGASTITRTRTEPDGRIITTTYSVKNVPLTGTLAKESAPSSFNPLPSWVTEKKHDFAVSSRNEHSVAPPPSRILPINRPVSTNYLPESAISEYLAKVGLTTNFLKGKNGEYTKTIIDDDGQVLTATFSLSSMIDDKEHLAPNQGQPIK